jgi:CRP/FNR family transcriptional regulator, cyclic AMP receptor protein
VEWAVLSGIPGEDVRELLSVARRRRFDRHEVVFHDGDPADSLHLIAKGRFGIRLMTSLGDEVLLDLLGPGDVFGELALVATEPAPRAATVFALESAETHCIYRGDFERLRDRYPSIDRVLVTLLAEQLRRKDQRLLEAHFVDVDRRVVSRLLDLCRVYAADSDQVTIPLTQDEVSALVGATRPSVNKVLRELQPRGVLELQRGKIIILDADALSRRITRSA